MTIRSNLDVLSGLHAHWTFMGSSTRRARQSDETKMHSSFPRTAPPSYRRCQIFYPCASAGTPRFLSKLETNKMKGGRKNKNSFSLQTRNRRLRGASGQASAARKGVPPATMTRGFWSGFSSVYAAEDKRAAVGGGEANKEHLYGRGSTSSCPRNPRPGSPLPATSPGRQPPRCRWESPG